MAKRVHQLTLDLQSTKVAINAKSFNIKGKICYLLFLSLRLSRKSEFVTIVLFKYSEIKKIARFGEDQNFILNFLGLE